MLIAARAILGVAAATLAPSTLSLISNMFHDPRQRSIAIGIWVASFSAGGALGPMLGGLLLEHFWWGSVFLLAVPVMILLLVLGPRLLPEFRDPAPGRIDLRSAVLSIAAVLTVIYGVKQVAADGVSLTALAIIAAGALIGAAFVHRQNRLEHPLMDLALFKHRAFAICLAIYVLGAFAAFGTFLTIAQYLQLVLGMGPLEAGLWTAPSGVMFIIGSTVAPQLQRWISKVRLMSGGLMVAAAGAALLALLGWTASLTVLVAAFLLFSLGLSLTFTFAVDLVVSSAPPERSGSASALAETGAELGGALGMAILGSVVTFVYRAAMASSAPAGTPDEATQNLGSAVAASKQLAADLSGQVLAAARDAFSHSIGITSGICAVVLVVASFAAARVPNPKPDAPAAH